MPRQVTIAEMALPDLGPEQRIARIPADLEQPWEGRLMVTLSVETDESLTSVLMQAGKALDKWGRRLTAKFGYFIRMGGMGDGAMADFATLVEVLPLVWQR